MSSDSPRVGVAGAATATATASWLAVLGALVGACGLSVTGLGAPVDDAGTDALASVDGGADGDLEAAPSSDADAEGSDEGAVPTGPVHVASVGAVVDATGLAQQTHLVYATHSARWWLFWFDDAQPAQMQASSSPDFVTWTAATPLALPGSHGNQGADLSVAYADIAGTDVLHLTLSLHFPAANDRRHFHVRATLSGAAILYGAVAQLAMVTDSSLVDPDGPATMITADGHVWDATGWATYQGAGNEVAWQSTGTDLGTSWDGKLGAQQNIAAAQTTVNARTFADVEGKNATVVALWELGDAEPDPTNVAYSTPGIIGWNGAANVFPGAPQSADDWDAVMVGPGDLRVIRRTLDGTYELLGYDGNAWTPLFPPPSDPWLAESGIVLLTDGAHLAVVAIAGDGASSVRQIVWNGVEWGAWATIEGSSAGRRGLTAWSSPGHYAVMWSESTSSGSDIVGLPVSFL
jgi:hypothetical protein